MAFPYPPKINLAQLPTPIQKVKRFFRDLRGPEIYLKRDDLTGFLLSGNKVRKLEFVVAEAQAQQADYLITCGGIQSNHARATAVAATQVGMKSYLVLRGDPQTESDGNLFIDHLMGAQFKFITPEQYRNQRNEIMASVAEELRRQGHRPYVIPEGASDELGAMGYLAATEEIVSQLKKLAVKIDAVITATGSGGTLAGLILGKELYRQQYDVFGVNVCDDEAYFVSAVGDILEKAQQRFRLNLGLSKNDVRIIDGYVGEGYALNRQEEIDLIQQFAAAEGIILDPVYTAKAMYGLIDQIKKGRFTSNQKILFLHSGGVFGMFPKRSLFH